MTTTNRLSSPIAPSFSVRAGRDAYLRENGLDVAGYAAPKFSFDAFGMTFTFTNPSSRKWAIPLHDLHHVATGYGTDLISEAEIGAFELAGGCKTTIVYTLDITAVLTGLFIAPLRTLRSFVHARRMRARALYRLVSGPDDVLDVTVGELRSYLGVPAEGLGRTPPRVDDANPLPRQPWWMLLLGVANGIGTFGTTSFELLRGRTLEGITLVGTPRLVAMGVALAGAVLALTAPAMRRGSIGGRALFGHAAFALLALNVVSFFAFAMDPAIAAFACSVPLILLAKLCRRS